MESKKINYKKPTMQVVEIQDHGHLLGPASDPTPGGQPQGSESGPGGAREQRSNWGSED